MGWDGMGWDGMAHVYLSLSMYYYQTTVSGTCMASAFSGMGFAGGRKRREEREGGG